MAPRQQAQPRTSSSARSAAGAASTGAAGADKPTSPGKPAAARKPAAAQKSTAARKPATPRTAAAPRKPTTARKPAAPRTPAQPAETPASVEIPEQVGAPEQVAVVVELRAVRKSFGDVEAVGGISLKVPAGTFYGLVGPNGAGKTTTLSIIAGLLRADAGEVIVGGIDTRRDALAAKRMLGVLPDRFHTFDRLTGRQLLAYYGALRGLSATDVESRTHDLARAFDLTEALGRVVSDYSAGMLKKVMLAGALIHSPRVLVLDEPFEAVDPVSSTVILDILRAYVDHGGTVILSSHGMELVERVCSRVAVIVAGEVVAEGAIDEVRGGASLEERYGELVGAAGEREGLEWLHTFSA